MAKFICEVCEQGFTRDKSGAKPIRFCSQRCYHHWRHINGITIGQFKKGSTPWNKGKHVRLSPRTEFKVGMCPVNKLVVGSTRIRIDKTGKHRAWVKVSEPNQWKLRAVVEWEKCYGQLPRGLLVHHADRNTLNDSLPNLIGVSRAAHLKEHRNEIEVYRIAAIARKR